MKLNIIFILSLLFLFTTSANLKINNGLHIKKNLNFDKEFLEIRLELQEADKRNQELESITNNKSQLKKIKRNIKSNK